MASSRMTTKGNITQYKSMPMRCCNTHTDMLKDAPML